MLFDLEFFDELLVDVEVAAAALDVLLLFGLGLSEGTSPTLLLVLEHAVELRAAQH